MRRHFENLFKEDSLNRPTLYGFVFESLSETEKSMLEEPFSEKEIKEVVWSCDGFSFEFLKNSQKVVKEDVFIFVRDFHSKDVQPLSQLSFPKSRKNLYVVFTGPYAASSRKFQLESHIIDLLDQLKWPKEEHGQLELPSPVTDAIIPSQW